MGRRMGHYGRYSRTYVPYVNRVTEFGPAYWIDSEHYTESAGAVNTWTDLVSAGHAFAVVGTRCALPTPAVGSMGGALVARFTGTQTYQSNAATASWNFISDGTGYTQLTVLRAFGGAANQVVHATQATGARSTGMDWIYNVVSGQNFLSLGTAAAVNGVALPAGVDRCIGHTYGVTTARTFSNGAQAATGATAAFAGAVAPMMLGADTAGVLPFSGYWCASIWFRRVLSDFEIASLSKILREKYSL